MARQQQTRQRGAYGAGSIVKDKVSGKWYFYYLDPISKKRKKKTLVANADDGSAIPVRTRAEAEKAAEAIRQGISALQGIVTTEQAQRELAKSRNLIVGMTITPRDIWQKFLDSPTRNQSVSAGRLETIHMVFKRFCDWCESNKIASVDQITAENINRFLRQETENLSSRSKRAYLIDIKTIFRHTYQALGMSVNPAQEIKGEKVISERREALSEEQIERIFQGFDSHFPHQVTKSRVFEDGHTNTYSFIQEYTPKHAEELRLVMMFALFCGARCKDCCLMTWGNVDEANGVIRYTPAKTKHSSGKVVEVPIFDEQFNNALWQAKSWQGQNANGENYICPNVAKWYMSNPTGVTETIGKIISYAIGEDVSGDSQEGRARKANRYGIHSFRHSFVTRCWRHDVKLEIVADIVGHSSPLMTETYLHKDVEQTRRALGALSFKGQLAENAVVDEAAVLRKEILAFANNADLDTLRKMAAAIGAISGPKEIEAMEVIETTEE